MVYFLQAHAFSLRPAELPVAFLSRVAVPLSAAPF